MFILGSADNWCRKKYKKRGKMMKKFISGILTGILITSTIALAASYIAEPASFKVLVNGIEFNSDPPALVVEGRTYLPLRAIGDALGVPVEWNAELNQAEVGIVPSEKESEQPKKSDDTNEVQISDKWKMVYQGCQTYREIPDLYGKAGDGKEFVVVTFDIENVSTEKQTFSMFFLSSYFDEYKTPMTVLGGQIDGATLLGANEIEPGKKIKGYLAYEVEQEWNKLDIFYNDSLTDTNNEIKFTIFK